MDYIQKAKKEIRNEWFENHVAEIEGKEGLQVIYWGQKGTNIYRVKYVLSGHNIFISGDTGEAVYTLTCPATLENIKGFDLHYLTGKLTAFCNNRWNFDSNAAKRELKEYWEDYEMNRIEDGKSIYSKIISAINESSSVNEYQHWLSNVYHETSLSSDDMESLWELGRVIPYRLIGYWVGLQMVVEQLEKNKPSETETAVN